MKPTSPLRIAALAVGALGLLLAAVALILGLSHIQRDGVNCGTALGGMSSDVQVQEYTDALSGLGASTALDDTCSAALSDRSTITWVVLVPGLILLVAGAVTVQYARTRPAQ